MEELILTLRKFLKNAVKTENTNCGLLFSGGIDTSILASLNPEAVAITVTLENFGEDIKYAKLLANKFNLKHFIRIVSIDEALDTIPKVIKILKSFDPAIPNDLAVYFGLKKSKELGINEVITGDGADELFAGYDFMKNIDDLEDYIKRVSENMYFSSNKLGKFFRIKIIQPYLDKEIIKLALKIPVNLKIKKENGKLWGKWILRKAFENILPKEIIWQNKRPLEFGSGMRKLREVISSKISDEEFKEKKRLYSIKFLNKEHLYYYEIYRREVGEIPKPNEDEKKCPGCGAGIKPSAFHCKVCGYVLNWRKNESICFLEWR